MEFPIPVDWTCPFSFYVVLDGMFHFCSNFNRTFCKQTVSILIRHRVLHCLIWVCTVFLCLTKRLISKQFLPSSLFCFPCPLSMECLMCVLFFLGIFPSRTQDCLVSNCSWGNSQFIDIKFTVLTFPPSWKKYPYTYES